MSHWRQQWTRHCFSTCVSDYEAYRTCYQSKAFRDAKRQCDDFIRLHGCRYKLVVELERHINMYCHISQQPCKIEVRCQWTTCSIPYTASPTVTWSMTSCDPKRSKLWPSKALRRNMTYQVTFDRTTAPVPKKDLRNWVRSVEPHGRVSQPVVQTDHL